METAKGRGLVAGGAKHVIRGSRLSVPLCHQPLGRGEGLEMEVIANCQRFNQLCLCKETRKDGSLRASRLVTTWRSGGAACQERAWEPHTLSPHLALGLSSTWLFLSYMFL